MGKKNKIQKINTFINNLIDKEIFSYGGNIQQIPIEVEGGEIAQLPNNQMIEFDGATHEQGGIPTMLPEGSTVFSDRIKIDDVNLSDRKKKRERKQLTLEQLTSKYNDILLKNSLQRVKEINQAEENYDRQLQQNVNNMIDTVKGYDEQAAYGREIADPSQNWFQPMPGMNNYLYEQNKRQVEIENPATTRQRQLSNIALGLSEMPNDPRYKQANTIDAINGFVGNIGGQLIREGLGDLVGIGLSKLENKKMAYGGTLEDEYLFEDEDEYNSIINPLVFDALIANDMLPKAANGAEVKAKPKIVEPWKYTDKVEKYGGEGKFGDNYLAFWNWMRNNPDHFLAKRYLEDLNSGKYGSIGKNKLTWDDIFNPKKTKRDESGNNLPLYMDSLNGPVHQATYAYLDEWNKHIGNPSKISRPITGLGNPYKIGQNVKPKNNLPKIPLSNQSPLTNTEINKEKDPTKISQYLGWLGRNLPNPLDIYSGIQLRKGIGNVGKVTNEQFGNTEVNINPYLQYGLAGLDKMEQSKQYVDRQRDNHMQDLALSRNAMINRNQNSARSVNTLRALNNTSDDYINAKERGIDNYFDQQMQSILTRQADLNNQRDRMVMTGEYQRDLADRQDRDNYYTNKAQDEASKFLGEQHFAKFLGDSWKNNVMENLVDGMSMYGFRISPFGELIKIKGR